MLTMKGINTPFQCVHNSNSKVHTVNNSWTYRLQRQPAQSSLWATTTQ